MVTNTRIINAYSCKRVPPADPYPGLAEGEYPAGEPEEGVVRAASEARVWEVIKERGYDKYEWVVTLVNEDMGGPCVAYFSEAPERPPLVSANDLYAVQQYEERTDFMSYMFQCFDGIDPYLISDEAEEADTRLITREIHDPYIDGYRVHTLATLWFDGKPFAVVQSAGRSGRDHFMDFVTDGDVFMLAWKYLKELETNAQDEDGATYYYDPDKKMRALNAFYGGYVYLNSGEE